MIWRIANSFVSMLLMNRDHSQKKYRPNTLGNSSVRRSWWNFLEVCLHTWYATLLTLSWRRCLSYRNQLTVYKGLTLSWQSSPSNRNQSIDLICKSMDWFPYDKDLHYERVNRVRIRFIEYSKDFAPIAKE